MRLPGDATLLVLSDRSADEPRRRTLIRAGEGRIAALLAPWRAAGLPVVHVRPEVARPQPRSFPGQVGDASDAVAEPRPDETVIVRSADDAFLGTDLEELLTDRGITTVVFCGGLAHACVAETAQHADRLGFRTFVVADVATALDAPEGWGNSRPLAGPADLQVKTKGDQVVVVDAATVVAAANVAGTRRRAKMC